MKEQLTNLYLNQPDLETPKTNKSLKEIVKQEFKKSSKKFTKIVAEGNLPKDLSFEEEIEWIKKNKQ